MAVGRPTYVFSPRFSRTNGVPKEKLKSRGGWGLLVLLGACLVVLFVLGQVPTPSLTHDGSTDRILPHGSTAFSRASAAFGVQDSSHVQPMKLMLSTHNRLFWYTPSTGEEETIHEGQGVYYGVIPGDADEAGELTDFWVVSRPHNWHAKTTKEHLLHLALPSGFDLDRVQIRSRFTHDAVRSGDSVFVCNTGTGALLQLSYPDMTEQRTLELFTEKEHINTISVFDDGTVWVVLHNLGKSLVAQVDVERGVVLRKIPNVGNNCHGLVQWKGLLVMLSSKDSRLITLDPATEQVNTIWQAEQGFFKGLAVVDDVAYFGISPPMERQNRDGLTVTCDLAAVSLLTGTLVFRRTLDTRGLLNIVSAPQLSEESTYKAVSTEMPLAPRKSVKSFLEVRSDEVAVQQDVMHVTEHAVAESDTAAVHAQVKSAVTTGDRWSRTWLDANPERAAMFPEDEDGGYWETGMPMLSMPKNSIRKNGILKKTQPFYVYMGKLPDALLKPFQEVVMGMPKSWWDLHEQDKISATIMGRETNLAQTKPGVQTLHLIFSSRDGDRIWQMPVYEHFRSTLDPILRATIGESAMTRILRMQLAIMNPNSHINHHKDSGPWCEMCAPRTHRIHLVVTTNPAIIFAVCPDCNQKKRDQGNTECMIPPKGDCVQVESGEGTLFEVNNLLMHEVANDSEQSRVHLVIDVAEDALPDRILLQPGQHCDYARANKHNPEPGC